MKEDVTVKGNRNIHLVGGFGENKIAVCSVGSLLSSGA
ncbi:hypothetical protein OROHE_008981 [Orobanche hederae]